MTTSWEHLFDIVPHAGPMRFIDRVDVIDGAALSATVSFDRDHLMAARDGVPSTIAIELFAQAAALLMASRQPKGETNPISGALLGSRRVNHCVPSLPFGVELTVRVEEVWHQGPLAQLNGTLSRQGEVLATGAINVASGALPS